VIGVSTFAAGEDAWLRRLGSLRNVVRQELIGRQLGGHVSPGLTVLDVGCGQGTQALRLAAAGCTVTGIDPSRLLLGLLSEAAAAAGLAVEVIEGNLAQLDALLRDRMFDLVCAHGVLMYLDDRRRALQMLTARVASGGLLSVTFRNGSALAFRPGMRQQWQGALAAFDAGDYVNELGVPAHADRLEEVQDDLRSLGVRTRAWYGVRVFTDPASVEQALPSSDELALLLDAEEQAGKREPYRRIASQIHLIGVLEQRIL
jgi:S-adenosylmethionine-dependent methyltransferase